MALLAAIWVSEWPSIPEPSPQVMRLARVGTAMITVLGGGLIVISLLPTAGKAEGNPIDATPESIAIGRMLYEQNCQSCHGVDGRGDGPLSEDLVVPPADFRQHLPYHTDDIFFSVMTNGLGTIMPGFGEALTEEERWHLLNFLQSEFGVDEQQPESE